MQGQELQEEDPFMLIGRFYKEQDSQKGAVVDFEIDPEEKLVGVSMFYGHEYAIDIDHEVISSTLL